MSVASPIASIAASSLPTVLSRCDTSHQGAGRPSRIASSRDQLSPTSCQFVVIQGADRRSGKLRPIKTECFADFANGTRVYFTPRAG